MRISDWSSDVCSSDLREAAEAGDQAGALGVRELVGMQLHRQAGGGGGLEHPGHLLRIEGDALAEAVDRVGEDGGRHRSDERRVGKECISTCRYRWGRYHQKKKLIKCKRNRKHK